MAKKTKNVFWYALGALIVIIGIFVFASSSKGVDVDFSQYNYTDDEVSKPNAAHVITEYSDFQCPYCGLTAPILHSVREDFDVRIEYKHFPLTQIHPYAQTAAEAAECARDQNKFWAMHDVMFANQEKIAKSYLFQYAEGLGLDMQQFEACVNNREKQTVVAQDVLEGQRLGIRGTPTLYLDGEPVQYRSYEEFAAVLR